MTSLTLAFRKSEYNWVSANHIHAAQMFSDQFHSDQESKVKQTHVQMVPVLVGSALECRQTEAHQYIFGISDPFTATHSRHETNTKTG